ncbi:MAG: hypothetical protein AAFV95_10215 [Bacteroidota bacterium]
MKKIIYRDEKGAIIEQAEMPVDQYHTNPGWIKGKFLTKEVYKDGKLREYTIFVDDKKDFADILQDEKLQGASISIGRREQVGTFRHEKLYWHKSDKSPDTILTEIFDEGNHVIVSSFTDDIENEIPYWNGTTKYYYDTSVRADAPLFECYYTDEGKPIPITIDVEELNWGDQDGTWVYADPEGIEDLMRIFKMSKALAEFYVSSEIIPKNIT